jgi:hypothetical protein
MKRLKLFLALLVILCVLMMTLSAFGQQVSGLSNTFSVEVKEGETVTLDFKSTGKIGTILNPSASRVSVKVASSSQKVEDGKKVYYFSLAFTGEREGTARVYAYTTGPMMTLYVTVNHDWNPWEIITPATCTEPGVRTRTCNFDPSHTETQKNWIDDTAHDWGAWEEITPATCETEGSKVRVCKRDDTHTETVPIPALGHDWGAWEEITPATCEAEGSKVRVCKRDDTHTETDNIPALGHDWGEWQEITLPACGQEGIKERVCKRDDTHAETDTIPALGHEWGAWETVTPPTASKPGLEKRICNHDASHVEQRDIPPILRGDANDDKQVDIGDVVSILEHMLSNISCISFFNADTNADTRIDTIDLLWVIEAIVQ